MDTAFTELVRKAHEQREKARIKREQARKLRAIAKRVRISQVPKKVTIS